MHHSEIAYLGPLGTYSHLVAEKRFGSKCRMIPFPTIHDICAFVSGKSDRHAVIPIENSSGGAIYEAVDILLAGKPRIYIDAELSLNVQLALLGRKDTKIQVLYSHFAPLEHASHWVRKNLPRVEKRVVSSTAAAAIRAVSELYAASLGCRKLATTYGLDVLEYPVAPEVPNLTVFYAISGRKNEPSHHDKTTLAVRLPNEPGALCSFLDTFRSEEVNLTRLISRPIRGCPREYAFLVDVAGGKADDTMKRAMVKAKKTATQLRIVGSYPTHKPYTS